MVIPKLTLKTLEMSTLGFKRSIKTIYDYAAFPYMIRELQNGSFSNGRISVGCKMCATGAKMVLFVSGICDKNCFYCPLSENKKDKDVIYADEMLVENDDDIIKEAESISSRGASITGGEPLLFVERSIKYINLLKDHFGENYHIHLYTASTDIEAIKKILSSRLDEIRFHVLPEYWNKFEGSGYHKAIITAKEFGKPVGVEIPGIPGMYEDLKKLITSLEKGGVDFVNINEFEYMDRTWPYLLKMGFEMLDGMSSAIKGSSEMVMSLLKENNFRIPIHFCSSGYKDGVQLRNRLLRRAKNVAMPWEEITEDGTIIKGIIEGVDASYISFLHSKFRISKKKCRYNEVKKRLELSSEDVERIGGKIDKKCFIIEEYPTADGLEVERIPIE